MTYRYENEGLKAKKNNPEMIKNINKEDFLASGPSPLQQL